MLYILPKKHFYQFSRKTEANASGCLEDIEYMFPLNESLSNSDPPSVITFSRLNSLYILKVFSLRDVNPLETGNFDDKCQRFSSNSEAFASNNTMK